MNYFIKREDKEYGPYTLADLQRYLQSGDISSTDLCHSEGMTDLRPVSQVVGNIPAPQPAQSFGTVYGGSSTFAAAAANRAPPPKLHWGLVLLFSILTCTLFSVVWVVVQAAFVRKIVPKSQAMTWLIIYMALTIGVGFTVGFVSALNHTSDFNGLSIIARIAGFICYLVGVFSMKSSLEEYYNSKEPIGLQLSGVMVFFFASTYFQYHFNEITNMQKAMVVTA